MTPREALARALWATGDTDPNAVMLMEAEQTIAALAALGYEVRSIDSTEGGRASGAPSGGVSPVPPSVEQVDDDAS